MPEAYDHPQPLTIGSPLLWWRYAMRSLARLVPPSTAKNGLLRWSGIQIGPGVFVGDSVIFIDGFRRGLIRIESRAVISPGSCIIAMAYPEQSPLSADLSLCRQAPVTIDSGAWIGSLAVIMPGVEIGECAVLGANSTATRSIPPREVWAGSPARLVRALDADGTGG